MESTQAFRRLFTIDEARALLPVILPEVETLVATFKEIRSELGDAASQAGLQPGSPELAGHLEARGIMPRLVQRVESKLESIHKHGCIVNGPEAGLIDFPCLYDREIVFLCWQFGEPAIAHWHRIPDGFAGRRPLLEPGDRDPAAIH